FKSIEERNDAVSRALEIIRNRVDQFGVSEPSIQKQGENRIVVELPGVKDPGRAESLLNVRGSLEFKLVDDDLSRAENFKDYTKGILNETVKLPEDREVLFVWQKDKDSGRMEQKYPIVVHKEAALTGAYLKTAGIAVGQFGDSAVDFELKSEGAERFYKITSDNVNKKLAIVLDNKVRSYPNIKEPLRDRGQITGNFTVQEAKDLALILRAGATPVKLGIAEKRIVGPSLGEDSIRDGVKAGLIASLVVIIFMLIYYKFAGVVANITLIINMFFTISVLILLKYTLTLPGLAGLALTVGMAVDSNVLIFERIKEELLAGKSLKASVDAGFEKAFSAILDSNITTLITSFILSQFGTGTIKGFAVTLFIGVTMNLFTAVYMARQIFNYIIDRFNLKRIMI
ncbi:MAG: protein translocase subunit SecD, partial [bacterium]|nr:protein translocase subunit SecD [bacterium]